MSTTLCFGGRIKLYLHSILGIACATIIECHSRLKVKSWDFACWLTMMCILQGRRNVQKIRGDYLVFFHIKPNFKTQGSLSMNRKGEFIFARNSRSSGAHYYLPVTGFGRGILSSPTPIRIIRNDWQSWKKPERGKRNFFFFFLFIIASFF
jgi:hypothetical protein